MAYTHIHVKGAKTHNLKNIDVKIPREKLVVITGLSGSGKSTLAFDTIYAEGQRRYVESLSAYARQFLEQMAKPDVESIEGLSPAISIEQRHSSRNPRSTVGTVTEIYDYLRLLFARVGRPHCYNCGKPIAAQTVSQMVDQIMEYPEGSKIHILAPVIRGRKGTYQKELQQFQKEGFVRVKIDGTVYELADLAQIHLDKKKKHDVDLFIDRLVVKKDVQKRLADSLEIALRHGEGVVKIEQAPSLSQPIQMLSAKSACIDCGISYPDINPQLFSFNNPQGACPECSGIGHKMYFDPDLIVPNANLSLRDGAIHCWSPRAQTYYMEILETLAKHYHFDIYAPFKNLPEKIRTILLNGSGEEKIKFRYEGRGGLRHTMEGPFEGVIPQLNRRWKETESEWVREDMGRFMNMRHCPACEGARLKKEGLFIKIAEKNISELTALSILDALDFFENLKLGAREKKIAERILKEIRDRLHFLNDVGLAYLALDRTSGTLSGGEDQRIRLATQIGSALTGVLYVLDEPSIGLHQRDNDRLLATLKKLRDLGNTVLVVEHDRDTILASDYVVDLGPGAGLHGGCVVATGTPKEILKNPKSLTGLYLSGKREIPLPKKRRQSNGETLVIKGAREHNLKDINVNIPLHLLTCVTGVSGSGKSTLINDILYRGLMQRLFHSREPAGKMDDILGTDFIDKVINIDQSPIGRTPRSNPATYTGIFTHVRDLFTELPESKARGYKPGRFSFNVKGGRCEACEGDGILKIEMHFLPDVYVECEVCQGKRFNRETLEVTFKGSSISDILNMTVEKACEFFRNIPPLREKLQTLIDVGMGYIELGQSATTLSGGEAQRIKLSRELSRRATGRTLYILDEPTTGLHFADVQKLIDVLNRLVDQGNSVVVIEHNLDVIKYADYCVDLGPEGGDNGGYVVAEGTPEEIVKEKLSYTGRYLREVLNARKNVVAAAAGRRPRLFPGAGSNDC